jgi:hypothetical protein
VALQTGALVPENESVAVEPAAKPLPEAVTLSPTAPWATDRMSLGSTTKSEEAAAGPWAAMIWWGPAEAAGREKVQANDPVCDASGAQRRAASGGRVSVTGALGPNPVPVAVIEAPTTPSEEESSRRGVTENVPAAWSPPRSVAMRVCDPPPSVGTGKVHQSTPAAEVTLVPPGVRAFGQASAVPAQVMV